MVIPEALNLPSMETDTVIIGMLPYSTFQVQGNLLTLRTQAMGRLL